MSIAQSERLVVTLSTIPSRISKIAPVLDSIKRQTRKPNRIYVCICTFCEWEKSAYEVPEWLLADDDVQITVSQRDCGPANKLLGMLHLETAPQTRIVIVDDDWLYGKDLLERLEERFQCYPGCAVGSSGARLPRKWSQIAVRIGPEVSTPPTPRHLTFVAEPPEDVAVDILQFGFGSMVLREWFEDDIYELIQPKRPLFFCDDVLFSGYLESRGIRRMCVSGISLPLLLDHSRLHPLSGEGRMTENYRAAVPTISSMLGIWPHAGFAFGLRDLPTIGELRSLGVRGMRKGYRVARHALSRLSRR